MEIKMNCVGSMQGSKARSIDFPFPSIDILIVIVIGISITDTDSITKEKRPDETRSMGGNEMTLEITCPQK